MITGDAKGERITVTGTVYDGFGQALKDALVEIWQADADGLFNSPVETRGKADPNFTGWGRTPGDMDTGTFTFETIKPGPVPTADGRMQAPHISFWIVARGINIGLQSRMYFGDETEANDTDPLLSRLEHRDRVKTLIAKAEGDGRYRFDIHIQGPEETVFLDI
jgi:protocatechuate 3,4-dioxygenase alpha subunit